MTTKFARAGAQYSEPSLENFYSRQRWQRRIALLAAVIVVAGAGGVASGQTITRPAIITSIASSGAGSVASTDLNMPYGVAVDSGGNVYIADELNEVVRKVTPSGTSTVVAGTVGVACSAGTAVCGDNGPATSAQLSNPTNMAVDNAGNLYIADRADNRVRMVNPAGIITTAAGTGKLCLNTATSNCGDGGAATSAALSAPSGVAVDGLGNLYIADTSNQRIRKVSLASGIISTIAGTGTAGYDHDNVLATTAEINLAFDVAVDNAGNVYIADRANNRIRKVTFATGIISTVAGDGTACATATLTVGACGDGGQATSGQLSDPYAVAVDSTGNVYIADAADNRIREVNSATGVITTVAGIGKLCAAASDLMTVGPCGDGGLATNASLKAPDGVAVDRAGNIYIGDRADERVRLVNATLGSIAFPNTPIGSSSAVNIPLQINTAGTTVTGISAGPSEGGKQEYAVTSSALPSNADAGTIYTATVTFTPAYSGQRPVSLQVTTNAGTFSFGLTGVGVGPQVALTPGTIVTLAGNGTAGYKGDSGISSSAQLNGPSNVAMDSAGNLYIADAGNNVVREVSSLGIITTVAGNGTAGFTGDNAAAISAELSSPSSVALDSAGNLYIADAGNNAIREVSPSGIITTIAGNGTAGFSGDNGLAINGVLSHPTGVAVDNVGNLYIADKGNNVIREVSIYGTILTVAGTGVAGSSGNHGLAVAAQLNSPSGVATDSVGNIYIADTGNNLVREVTTWGVIAAVAGNGTAGLSGNDGPAIGAELSGPFGVTVDGGGNLYIADTGNNVIREVTSAGTISTIAGNGTAGSTGNSGPATAGELNHPSGVVLDSAGDLYIADTNNHEIRQIKVLTSSLLFADAAVGSTSADSPQTAVLSNIGNAPLTFSVPSSGQNPSLSNPSFTLAPSSTCPQLSSSSSAATLAPGNSCKLLLSFTPKVTGAVTGTATITDNALNIASSVQTISLKNASSAIQPVATTTTVKVLTPNYGQTQVSATVSPVSGTGVPVGSVVFTVDGVAQPAVTLNGAGIAPLATSSILTAGSHTVSAAYSSSALAFLNSTGSSTFAVATALTSLTLSVPPSPVTSGVSVTLSATISSPSSGTPTGKVTFLANNVSLGTGTLSGGIATLTLTTLPAGTDAITATYAGDINFTGSTTTASTVTVIVPNFTVTSQATYLVVGPGGSTSCTLSLAGQNGFSGPVTFTATGLPAGATASFSPATVSVSGSATPTTTMTITVAAGQALLAPSGGAPEEKSPIRYALLLLPISLLGIGRLRKRMALLTVLGVMSLGAMAAGLTGCSGMPQHPPAIYTVTVIGTNGSLARSTTVTLAVE